MSIGKTLKEIRKQRNLTQAALAQEINISRSYLSDIENGNKNPSIKTIENLAQKLNVSVNYLTSGNKMYTDLTDDEKKEEFLKLNKKLASETTSREATLKNNLLELIKGEMEYFDVHFLNNAFNFYEIEKDDKDNLLFISVLLQQLYNYKGSESKEVYDDIKKEFDEFLKKYLNIK